jgi:hypothetical protein
MTANGSGLGGAGALHEARKKDQLGGSIFPELNARHPITQPELYGSFITLDEAVRCVIERVRP